MSRMKTHLEGIGEIEVDAFMCPADPDAGIPRAYVDELIIYKDGDFLEESDYEQLTPEDFRRLEDEYIRFIEEQAAIGRAYQRGRDIDA